MKHLLSLASRFLPNHKIYNPEKKVSIKIDAGTITPEELLLLKELIEESISFEGPIVEIGTLFGLTTIQMATFMSTNQKVITVDNFSWNPWGLTPEQHYWFTSSILLFLTTHGQIEIMKSEKNKFYEIYQGDTPSLVFLDAIHTYEETKKDIDWAINTGAKIVCGHDYASEFPGVIQAVNEAGGPKRLRGTLWSLQ